MPILAVGEGLAVARKHRVEVELFSSSSVAGHSLTKIAHVGQRGGQEVSVITAFSFGR